MCSFCRLTLLSFAPVCFILLFSHFSCPFFREGLKVPCTPPEDSAPIRALLEREDRPTAILVSDDLLGLVLLQLCSRLGLSIPEDLSILSFNNSLFARLSVPQLSSIDVNSFQLGIEAASQLINHIENPNLLAAKIIVPYSLIERDSCRRL